MGSGVGVGRDTIRPMALTKTLEKWDTCREHHLFVMLLWSFWAAPGFWIQTVLDASSSSTTSWIFDLCLPTEPQFSHLQHDDHKIWSWDFVRPPAGCLIVGTAEEMQTPFFLFLLALFPSFLDKLHISVCLGFPDGQMVRNLPAMQKT